MKVNSSLKAVNVLIALCQAIFGMRTVSNVVLVIILMQQRTSLVVETIALITKFAAFVDSHTI